MKISDLTLSSVIYSVGGCKITKRHIKTFDIDRKEIKLYDATKDDDRTSKYDIFQFETLDDSFLKQGNNIKVFFTKEEAAQGLIEALRQQIKEDEDDIRWRTEYVRKAKRRLNFFEEAQ